MIRSVPIKVPYLDFRLFLNSIAESRTFKLEAMLEVLCHVSSFDPGLLSTEEQMELNQLLFRFSIRAGTKDFLKF